MSPCDIHAHITDSDFFSHGYATEEARRIFCDKRRLQRWLEVECALLRGQARLGIIPAAAAERLQENACLDQFDLQAIKNDIALTGHSLVPLLREWQRVTADKTGEYIHFGATTQDIQDTAQALELKEICAIIQRDLAHIIQLLAGLANKYKDLSMIGRTHGQAALPTTMGLKIAGWLDETLRNQQRLTECQGRLWSASYSAVPAAWTSLSDNSLELLNIFALDLGLGVPDTAWHACRDRTAEFISHLALTTGGLGRIANEICQLTRDEIGELAEPFEMGQIGSSTMPHKKNPELCEQVVVLAKLVKNNAAAGLDCLLNEHERDYRAVRLEWAVLTEAALYSCAALSLMKKILSGLKVNKNRISHNLDQAAIMVCSEALMFVIGEKTGKQSAHQIIYQATMNSTGLVSLLQKLYEVPEVNKNFSIHDLEEAVKHPRRHIGQAVRLVNQVLARVDNTKLEDQRNIKIPPCPVKGCDKRSSTNPG